MPIHLRDRLARVIATHRASVRAIVVALVVAVFVAGFIAISTSRRNTDLSHVNVAFMSGSEQGNYHAVVARAGVEARRRGGRIDNVRRGIGREHRAARRRKVVVPRSIRPSLQDGLPWPEDGSLELIARLPVPESLVILGRNADAIRSILDLRGLRIGIGPVGSGTAHVARQVMAQLTTLEVKPSTHTFQEQLAQIERGDLDLAAFVIESDARLVVDAVRERKMQIVDMAGAESLAHRLPSARAGVINAGYYDPVRQLPPTDKRVITVDTLVIGNGCARASATQGVITALARVYPAIVRINREEANFTGLPIRAGRPGLLRRPGSRRRRRAPAVGDRHHADGALAPADRRVLVPVRGAGAVAPVSPLAHRFGARRHRERGRGTVRAGRLRRRDRGDDPGQAFRHARGTRPPRRDDRGLDALARRCRRQSLSMLVPMGQEMNYRYQGAVADFVHALRKFRAKLA